MENTNSTKVPRGAGAGRDYEIDFGALNNDWKGEHWALRFKVTS